MKHYLLIAALGFSGVVNAAPVTIDFEEFSLGEPDYYSVDWEGPLLQSQGFDIWGIGYSGLSNNPSYLGLEIDIGNNGTKSFGNSFVYQYPSSGCCPFTPALGVWMEFKLSRSDGGAFALHNVDFFTQNNGSTSVVGYMVGGGTVDLSTALGTGGWLNLEHVAFTSAGQFSYTQSYATGELDNIVVSAVPIPAALWLFASALGLLGVRQRLSRT